METVESVIGRWKPAAGQSHLQAAQGLAQELGKAGCRAEVAKKFFDASGIAVVELEDGDDAILVHAGNDASALRDHTKRVFAGEWEPGTRLRLAGPAEVPPDVAFLFSGHAVIDSELALIEAGATAPNIPLAKVGAKVPELAKIVSGHLGVSLDPDQGLATLDAIDDLVLKIRPPGTPEDEALDEEAAAPFQTLIALGLIATETTRRMAKGGRLTSLGFGGMKQVRTLGEADAAPAVQYTESLIANVAQKVHKRWANGAEDSVAHLWSGIRQELAKIGEPVLAEEPAKDDDEGAADALKSQLRLVGMAPYAAFLLIAAADGKFEKKELKAFIEQLANIRHPLFKMGIMLGPSPEAAIQGLLQNPEMAAAILAGAGKVFREHPEGRALREELMDLARAVAKASSTSFFGLFGGKDVRKQEQFALGKLEELLDTLK